MRIGLHYSLQVAPGGSQTVIREAFEDIAWADANGFSSVVFAEHHFFEDCWIPRPIQLATAAAAITKNVRIGTDIVILPLHHPVAIAEEAALADVVAGGRFILGVGLGWREEEYAGFGVPFKQRAKVYERSIDIVRRLLRGETVSDSDGHYRFHGARVRPQPVNGNGVPLWMGGIADAAIDRIARVGDAWIMSPGVALERLVQQQRLLKEQREALGLPSFRDWPLRREAFVADTDARAWELYAPALRHEYGNVYRSLFKGYPDNDTIDNLRKWGESTFAVGSPRTVAERLNEYGQALHTTEFLIRFQLPYIARGAARDSLSGLKEVMELLQGTG